MYIRIFNISTLYLRVKMEWITYAFIKVEIPILFKYQDVKPYAYPTKI